MRIAVEFHFTGDQPYVCLSPAGKAEIKVDNKPLHSKIALPSGSSTLNREDLLSGVTTKGGEFRQQRAGYDALFILMREIVLFTLPALFFG